MLSSAIRHLFWMLILLLILSLLSFSILLRDPLNAELVTNSLLHSYWSYVKRLLHGDFGITYNGGESLWGLISTVLPPTLELCTTALLLAFLFAIPLGIISAIENQRFFARALQGFSAFGLSIPVCWLRFCFILLRFIIGKLLLAGNITCFTRFLR